MEIRKASATDIPRLHALIESAYRGDSARRGWTHEADLLGGQRTDPEALAAMIDSDDHTILVGEEGGDIIGCIAVTRKAGDLAYIGMMTVDPVRQAGGLGRRLLAAGEMFARDRLGARTAEMTVIEGRDELMRWYERRGYSRTGETRPFPDDPRFGLPQRPLAFAVFAKPLC